MTQKLGDRLMVVFGPPGTGKTTRMLELLESELGQGILPEDIAFATFTKSARAEAQDRAVEAFDLSPEQLRWFRTLHSTAYHLLGMNREIMYTAKLEREFCAQYHYELTAEKQDEDDDQIGAPPRKTRDDDLRAAHEWGIHRMMTLRETWSKGPIRVDLEQLELYVERFTTFKDAKGVFDFNDMLVRGLEIAGPPVRVAFIDEAQDLTPLQIASCYRWYGDCDRVYVAGDDDQAIYLFAGADPGWMMALKDVATHHELLEQSYRVPQRVQDIAEAIIRRNKRRVVKPYKSAKLGGHVECTTQRKAIERAVGRADDPRWSTFILVRNRMFAQRVAAELMRQGVPFRSEIGAKGPLGKKQLCKAVLAANRLLQNKTIDGVELRALLKYVPSGQYAPRGIKTRSRAFEGRLTRMQAILEWGMGEFVKRLENHGPALGLFKEKRETLEYLDRVLKRFGDLPAYPQTLIMTIHGAKGREANTVIVISDMAKASWLEWQRDAEGENRVAYVAVTRAKDELLLCDPETPRHFPYWEFVKEKVPF